MRLIRWQEKESAREEALWQRMRQDGLHAYTWSNGPGDRYAAHSHSYEKVLYCVRGSIRFVLPDMVDENSRETTVDMASGDCLILSPGERHSAQVGDKGVTCLEAARD